MRGERYVEHIGEMRNSYTILVGKSEGKRTFGKLGIYVRMILKWILKTGCGCMDWIPSVGFCEEVMDFWNT
jgi:hypothetical protein